MEAMETDATAKGDGQSRASSGATMASASSGTATTGHSAAVMKPVATRKRSSTATSASAAAANSSSSSSPTGTAKTDGAEEAPAAKKGKVDAGVDECKKNSKGSGSGDGGSAPAMENGSLTTTDNDSGASNMVVVDEAAAGEAEKEELNRLKALLEEKEEEMMKLRDRVETLEAWGEKLEKGRVQDKSALEELKIQNEKKGLEMDMDARRMAQRHREKEEVSGMIIIIVTHDVTIMIIIIMTIIMTIIIMTIIHVFPFLALHHMRYDDDY